MDRDITEEKEEERQYREWLRVSQFRDITEEVREKFAAQK